MKRKENVKENCDECIVKTDDLKLGIKVGQDIVNRYGGVIIPAGTVLKDKMVAKLLELNYVYIKIIVESDKEIKENIDKLSKREKNQPRQFYCMMWANLKFPMKY